MNKLPLSLKKYFWDVDFAKLDKDDSSYFIIERLLEYGDTEDTEWMKNNFKEREKQKMKNWIIKVAFGMIIGKVLPKLINNSITEKEIEQVADKYAGIVTDAGKRAAGKNWTKLEDSIQSKASLFFSRFMKRLDYDD